MPKLQVNYTQPYSAISNHIMTAKTEANVDAVFGALVDRTYAYLHPKKENSGGCCQIL